MQFLPGTFVFILLGEGSNENGKNVENMKKQMRKQNNMNAKLNRIKCSFFGIICLAPILIIFNIFSIKMQGAIYFSFKMYINYIPWIKSVFG